MCQRPVGQLKKKGSIGSAYAVRDYYAINPDYGSAVDLKHLVQAAHTAGFKIIVDIAANHTSGDAVLMKHPEYYKQYAGGNVIPPVANWSDVAGLSRQLEQIKPDIIIIAPRRMNRSCKRAHSTWTMPGPFTPP
jgi:glycosidase